MMTKSQLGASNSSNFPISMTPELRQSSKPRTSLEMDWTLNFDLDVKFLRVQFFGPHHPSPGVHRGPDIAHPVRIFKKWSEMNALSFYRSKMILDRPNRFGQIQTVLVGSKLFWSGPNYFGQVLIRFLFTNFYNLDLSKMIWSRPKQIGCGYSTKMIWTLKNSFGP